VTASRADARASGVVALLAEAARRYDASPELRVAARRAARSGFGGGAAWMAQAMAAIRGAAGASTPSAADRAAATRLGFTKYGAASAALLLVGGAATTAFLAGRPVLAAALAAAAGAAFYLVEAQGAFAFPALVDGATDPWRRSRELVCAAGGTGPVAARTVVIAAAMLGGGFLGRGFLRSWCVGALAVALWYEALRR